MLGPEQTKWVEALRSGKFKQGKFKLRSENDRFCCLGIYEHISGTECERDTNEKFYRYTDKRTSTHAVLTLTSMEKLENYRRNE